MALMTQRAYARHRAELGLPGTTHRAVQKAIEAGRIKVNVDGLIDSDDADRAWASNSSEGHRRNTKQEAAAKAKAPKKKSPPDPPADPDPPKRSRSREAPPRSPPPAPPPNVFEVDFGDVPAAEPGMSLAEASALEKVWKAKLAELEFAERSGKLVPAEEVVARWVELVTIAKTKLLAVRSKAKARIPKLTASDIGILDELIREALEELAQEDDEEEGGDDGR